jgi:quercetin dioxygenase-like cupin family protein
MTFRPKPDQERPLHEALQVFDLEQTYEQLRAEPAYAAGRNAITLRKGPNLQIVVLAQQAGNVLDEHRAVGPITLQVLRGRVRFATAERTADLDAGMLLALDAGIVHSVEALDDSLSVLTLNKK